MTVLDGTIWIETGNGLVLFDPERREEIERIRVPGGIFGVTPTPTGLWGVSGGEEELLQLDPATRRILGRVEVDGPLFGLTFARGQIWLGTQDGLVRIDPNARRVVETIDIESFQPQNLAVDANEVMWISSGVETEVVRFDLRTLRVRDRIEVGGSLFGGVVIGDSYWVSGNDGTIYRLSAESGDVVDQVELVGFGPMPAAGSLWTVDFLSNSVFRLDEAAD
jgi:sugar lactone lactonase YvrE